MRIDRSLEHARNVKGPKEAARLANDINYELALGDHPPEHERQGEEALRHLEERYPGTHHASLEIEDPPRLSHRAGRRLREHGESAHERVRARRGGRPPAQPAAPAPRQRTSRPARAGQARRAGGRALELADQATGGWGSTLGDMFVWAMGLSIFYLLITKARVVGKLSLGASNVVRAVVSPVVDPLNPTLTMRSH